MADKGQVSTAVNLVTAILLVSSWAFVSARIFVRFRDQTRGVDDLLMVISLFFFTICCVFTLLTNVIGVIVLDKLHEWPQDHWYHGQLYFLCAQIFYAVTSVFIRASLCVSLLRIAYHPRHRAMLYAVIVTSILAATAVITGILTQAYPINTLWDVHTSTSLGLQTRGNNYLQKFLLVFSAVSIMQDMVIAAMPAVILWDLQRSRIKRIRPMILLGLGASAAIAILVRIFFLTNQYYSKYGKSPIFICTIFELAIAMIAGSLAPLRKSFVRRWRDLTNPEWQRLRAQAPPQPLLEHQLQLQPVVEILTPAVTATEVTVTAVTASDITAIEITAIELPAREIKTLESAHVNPAPHGGWA